MDTDKHRLREEGIGNAGFRHVLPVASRTAGAGDLLFILPGAFYPFWRRAQGDFCSTYLLYSTYNGAGTRKSHGINAAGARKALLAAAQGDKIDS
jgi:hypothetical protein